MRNAIRSHKVYVPLITLAVSAGLYFLYYSLYVHSQRNYADDRAFRLLTVSGDQVAKKYENLRNIFAAALASKNAQKYLEAVFKDKDEISNFSSTCPACTGPACTDRRGDLTLKLVDKPDRSFVVEAVFQPATKSCILRRHVDLNKDLRELFDNVTAEYFDDILIATATGEVLFQKSLSGVRITNLNTLLLPTVTGNKTLKTDGAEAKKPPPPAKGGAEVTAFQDASQFSNVIDVKVAGVDYKLYLQPGSIPVKDRSGQELKGIICGLWRTDRLQSEVVSIPYSALNWGALILLAIFGLTWPLLKVAFMSPSERLRRRHVFYLLISALFSTTMLTLIVLNWSYAERGDEESNEQLKALADRIELNVKTELGRALAFMDDVDKDTALHAKLLSGGWNPQTDFLQSELFQKNLAHTYPYFDNLSWVAKDGKQKYKITVRDEATPPTSLAERPFFKDVLRGVNLRPVNGLTLPGDFRPGDEARFRFDSVYSSNDGEYYGVLARQDPLADLKDVKAQVLVGKFLSLADPIVPEGYGYAVVSHDGTAQFHSVSARNGIENFFEECRQDPTIKTLVLNAGRSDYVRSNYLGKPQEMAIRPMSYLADPAPALIVFRDTNYFGTIHVACFLVFALLAGLFSAPFAIGLAIYIFQSHDYPLEAFWPNKEKLNKYVNVITANVCLTAAFVIRFQRMTANQTLLALIAIAAAAVAFATLKPKWANGEWTLLGKGMVLVAILLASAWSWALLVAGAYIALSVPPVSRALDPFAERSIKLKYLYLGTVFSLLTVVVVLPCFGLFKISYDTVNRLALEAAQLKRRDQLKHRDERISKYFSQLGANQYADARFKEAWDRYDEPLLFPKPDNELYAWTKPDVSWLEPGIAWATPFFPSNRFGAEVRQMATEFQDGSGPPWTYARGHDGDDALLWPEGIAKTLAPNEELVGVYPLWQLPWGAAVAMVLLAVLLAAWLAYLIRRVFLTDLEDAPQFAKWTDRAPSENLLILGPPMSGKSGMAASRRDADVLDLEKMVTTGDWSVEAYRKPIVVVDHFEFDIDNPDTCLRKLALLEQLLYVKEKRVILLSAVDPMFYLVSSSPEIVTPTMPDHESPMQLLERWAAVLRIFEKRHWENEGCPCWIPSEEVRLAQPELAEVINKECGCMVQLQAIASKLRDVPRKGRISAGQAMEELLSLADSFYRVLLSTCSKEERLVLYQLATDGWANPGNGTAIQQLQRRGIIKRGSAYRIMNESFSRFIRAAQCPAEIAQWESEEQQSTWGAVKLGLTTGAFALGAWLLYTQQAAFQAGIGYVAALGTAGGTVLSLFRSIKGTAAPVKRG